MIMYKIICARCNAAWEETVEDHDNKRDKYTITEYKPGPSGKPPGRYVRVDLCPNCMKDFEKFLKGRKEPVIKSFYIAVGPENGGVKLIGKKDISRYLSKGYKVVRKVRKDETY